MRDFKEQADEEYLHFSNNPNLILSRIRAFFFPFTAFRHYTEKGLKALLAKYPDRRFIYIIRGTTRRLIYKNNDLGEWWIWPEEILRRVDVKYASSLEIDRLIEEIIAALKSYSP